MSPEFWTVIDTGVALFASMIAIASLIPTIAGWQRTDMGDLFQKIEAIKVGQGEIREVLPRSSRIGAEVVDSDADIDLIARADRSA